MKKYTKFAFLFLILVCILLGIALYTNMSRGNEKETQKEKTLTEVEFLEEKLVSLLNEINRIEIRNYNVSASEISKQAEENANQETSNQTSKEKSEGGQEGSNSSSSENTTSNKEQQQNEKFDLTPMGVLTTKEEINWEKIKTEVETLYSSIPTITLDLYQVEVSQEDILGFNQNYDQLAIVVKEENKENTLAMLAKLYEYIPKFMEKTTDEEILKVCVETKANLFKAYSKLDSKNWSEIANDVKQMIETYTKLLSSTNIDASKQYAINKVYVMLNELQNAVNIEDESVFLIKYKNILEEMNNL